MKATVLVMTYGHAPWIAAALDSVLAQETDFPFEVVVSEDCSTDGTREIAEAYRDRHPDRVRLALSERNRNDNTIVSRGLEAARGEYVALLDGDDLWTSPHKLQTQVDFLDRRPDCSLCFHNVLVTYDDGAAADHPWFQDAPAGRLSAPVPKPTSGLADLVAGNFIQTCSVLLRASAPGPLPDWYRDLPVGDWPLYVLCAERGDLGYVDEVLAAYRVHAGGVWSMNASLYRDAGQVLELLRTYDVLDRHLGGRHRDRTREARGFLERSAVLALLREGRRAEAVAHLRRYAREVGLRRALGDRALVAGPARAAAGRARRRLPRGLASRRPGRGSP